MKSTFYLTKIQTLVLPQRPPSTLLENSANAAFNVSGILSQEEVIIKIYDGSGTFACPGSETRIVVIGTDIVTPQGVR